MEKINYEDTTEDAARNHWVYSGVNYEPDLRMLSSYNGKVIEHVYRNVSHTRNVHILLNGESVTHELKRQFEHDFPGVVALNTVFTSNGEARVLCLKSA